MKHFNALKFPLNLQFVAALPCFRSTHLYSALVNYGYANDFPQTISVTLWQVRLRIAQIDPLFANVTHFVWNRVHIIRVQKATVKRPAYMYSVSEFLCAL